MAMTKLARLENFLLTLWIGGIWAIGYMAVPLLFKLLDDRKLAGSVAGEMFMVIGLIGLVCSALLLAMQIARVGWRQWRAWCLLGMFIVIAVSLFALQPSMADLKAQGLIEGSETAKQFGILHGISSVLYLVNSLCGLLLVVAGLHRLTPLSPRPLSEK